MSTIIEQISRAGSNKEKLARDIMRQPEFLNEVMAGLNAKPARIKFGCAKVLRIISEQQPELLYPYFDTFARLLDHENKILQWEAIMVLARLVKVDPANKFEAVFDRYFKPVTGPVMITAANIIASAATIARAKPAWADRIATEILKVRRAQYQTEECRNVVIGHAIASFGEFMDLIQKPKPVVKFVTGQLGNSRNATRKKAEIFFKKQAKQAK